MGLVLEAEVGFEKLGSEANASAWGPRRFLQTVQLPPPCCQSGDGHIFHPSASPTLLWPQLLGKAPSQEC